MGKPDDSKEADKPKAEAKPTQSAAPVKSAKAIDPNENGSAKVSLSVYLKQRKIPADQAAGFTLYVRINEIGIKTPEQWRRLQETFNKRPI